MVRLWVSVFRDEVVETDDDLFDFGFPLPMSDILNLGVGHSSITLVKPNLS